MAARHIGLKALLQLLPRGPGSGLSPSLPGSLQLVSWLCSGSNASSSSAAPADGLAAAPQPSPAAPLPRVDAAEIARALRCQQFYEDEIQTLRALKSSLPHDHLLDFMRQRCERRQQGGAQVAPVRRQLPPGYWSRPLLSPTEVPCAPRPQLHAGASPRRRRRM